LIIKKNINNTFTFYFILVKKNSNIPQLGESLYIDIHTES
jgi:hypothetical protein